MFFKKIKKDKKTVTKEKEMVIDQELLEQINTLEEKTKNDSSYENLYDLACCYKKNGDTDKSIELYEECLKKDASFNKGNDIYINLTSLYNIKRKEAAKEKNDQKIQEYLEKMDNLMQLSKDVMRGKR